MLDVYFWNTPNGYKVLLFLEETALPYRLVPVNIGKGEQFAQEFLEISPNNKIPALVDTEPSEGKGPISVFESGAILLYLAEKNRKFLPQDVVGRYEVVKWLFWQMAGLGPIAGQNGHFSVYASEKIPYAIQRYVNETNRLYGVMNKRLRDREFLAGDYSIADMACYPWIVPYKTHGQDLNEFPNLKRWFEAIQDREATKRAYAKGNELSPQNTMSEEAKKILFGQTAKHVE